MANESLRQKIVHAGGERITSAFVNDEIAFLRGCLRKNLKQKQ